MSNASLASAGVIKVAQLRELGSVLAYARVKRARGKANVTLIWALGEKAYRHSMAGNCPQIPHYPATRSSGAATCCLTSRSS
ncbi:MAG: TfoX/Sxy family DNA transformation protein [Burkholderiales bacterium]